MIKKQNLNHNNYPTTIISVKGFLYIYFNKFNGWFRIFGVGLSWKHQSVGLLFSERIGKRKYMKIGKWIIKFLKKEKITFFCNL